MTAFATIDAQIASLRSAAVGWSATPIPARIALLERTIKTTLPVLKAWVDADAKGKGIDPESNHAGELWLSAAMPITQNLRNLIDSLAANAQPRAAKSFFDETRKQYRMQVMPETLIDKMLFTGFRAETWIEPGQQPTQGKIYRDDAKHSGVCAVLGGGNVSSIGPMDILQKLFIDNEVVIIKMHPVNDYTGPLLERAFSPLIEQGVLSVVYGGADIGSYLTAHAGIDSIHITGSAFTHDAIIWGSDPVVQAANKAANTPVVDKPISSELGCVTPVIIVPGQWSASDVDFQAEHVASMVVNNASFNCNAAKVLVVSKSWPQRDAFVDAVRRHLRGAAPREAFYPGACQRYEKFLAQYPQAEVPT